ncbi:PREDICTED: adenylate cyclase type 3-like [Priapulus caudatus]|uniref:adenylate cyclase n=1 Tax=Priapulus caudatus TaxID=37621 RepID=A0ABM1EKM7_PRICU|nr:PREDICTED: adenylate cyclase type 3-like [Priapulus caudatus]
MKQVEQRKHERLLLSVLPRHVAAAVLEDFGAMVDGQFKKIYITRYENVSILFADIVGFTALSSTCTAAELVKILNELFARFDKLADRYHQLRIKILGDCYYCISGAPVPRTDHAVLCVHMGLSMVNAIRYVREKTKTDVDMRVGIHTGAVLAGILGQKQWQYDVYSKDVIFANKMESGGIGGRVHVSDSTCTFLNGEFQLEDGYGEIRDESIKNAGVRTYLISSVIKPPKAQGNLSRGYVMLKVDVMSCLGRGYVMLKVDVMSCLGRGYVMLKVDVMSCLGRGYVMLRLCRGCAVTVPAVF